MHENSLVSARVLACVCVLCSRNRLRVDVYSSLCTHVDKESSWVVRGITSKELPDAPRDKSLSPRNVKYLQKQLRYVGVCGRCRAVNQQGT